MGGLGCLLGLPSGLTAVLRDGTLQVRPEGSPASRTASRNRRGAWGLFAVAAVFVVLFSTVAAPSASAHPPEAKTICPDGYTLSADEAECSKTAAKDEGPASCDPGYDLVPKTRGASSCEKVVGEPTYAKGKGDDCVTTTDHGPPTCANGNLKNGVTADLAECCSTVVCALKVTARAIGRSLLEQK